MVTNGDPPHLFVGERHLTIDDVVSVARSHELRVAGIAEACRAQVEESAAWVEAVLAHMGGSDEAPAYYGINTGFGAQAGKAALQSEYETQALSRNLITSHSAGVGTYFDEEIVRAAMLLRAHSLAQGVSGVRPELIEKLITLLNKGVYPAVPSKGSLGASGDLAPLSHLALAISAAPRSIDPASDWQCDDQPGEAFEPLELTDFKEVEGRAIFPVCHVTTHRLTGETTIWKRTSSADAMRRAGAGDPIVLRAKEGLAFNNGATFSAAIATLTIHDARNLLRNAELALALSLEGMCGVRDPFLPKLLQVRGHQGAIATAQTVMEYVQGSKLLDPGDEHNRPDRIPPQDPYSLRCAPHVLGAVRDTLEFVERTISTEINAATDNPLIFTEYMGQGRRRRDGADDEPDYLVFSGGNFHGEPIAFAMDFLGIAITELGSIAERRIFKMTDYHFPDPWKGPHLVLQDANGATRVLLPSNDSDWEQADQDQFAVVEIGGQRYVYRQTKDKSDDEKYGLPGFLLKEPKDKAVSSGFMIPQYTAASLVSECKTLAHPDSVDSIPSSANKEDHVSMSLNAASHARQIVDNIEAVIAIEYMCAAQAIDLQGLKRGGIPGETVQDFLGVGTREAYRRIRAAVPYFDRDRAPYPYMRRLIQMIRTGEILRAPNKTISY